MSGAPTPQTLLEAIANSAPVGSLPGDKTAPMPETQPITPNAASIQLGFPPIVMENENAGGKPPLGPDMNGLLFLISSHTLYVECGQTYQYNSTLATAIGGYASGTILGTADGTGLWLNVVDGNTNNPDTGGAGWVPFAAYGVAQVSGLVGGVATLSATDSKFDTIVLNGTLTSNLTVIFPQAKKQWLVINRTSGAFTVSLKTSAVGSLGVTVPQGGYSSPLGVYSIGDGNLYPTVAPLSVPIDQNATPLTLVERTNIGAAIAYLFNSTAPVATPTVGNVIVDSGNGYFQKIALTNFEAQLLLQGMNGSLVNSQVPFSVVAQWAASLFLNAALTGTPTAPTPANGTSNTDIATAAFANPGVTVNGNGTCFRMPGNQYKLQFGTCNPAGGTANITYPVAFSAPPALIPVSIAGGAVQTWLPTPPGASTAQIANSGGSSIWIAFGI